MQIEIDDELLTELMLAMDCEEGISFNEMHDCIQDMPEAVEKAATLAITRYLESEDMIVPPIDSAHSSMDEIEEALLKDPVFDELTDDPLYTSEGRVLGETDDDDDSDIPLPQDLRVFEQED